jgi:NADH-quinone oxidoreductase subunit G
MADLVTITIDGQQIEVPKGALVIEAATQLGIDVPRFCYHPKLSAVGMCRMCLGEVGMPKMNPDRTPALNEDGTPQIAMMPKPQTLCTTQAADGMVVLTETEAVKKMQNGVLEFFLANHPLDCPICDKGGECMLQDQAMSYGQGASRVQDLYHQKKDLAKHYPLSELIALDQERCIQCARCTRFSDEIAHDHVLGLYSRGSKTYIGSLSDPPFDSKFSGNTVDICPVGALTSRAFRFRARVWELKNTPTVSMIDGSGTNIFVSQRNETFVRVIPRDNEAINECWISDRDRFGLDWVDHPDRLAQPLVRREGKLQPVSWDEALQLVADKIREANGAIGAVGGAKLTNEGALAMARLFRETVDTPNVDHEWQPTLANAAPLPSTFYEELESADVILVVGANPNEELPILDLRLKKAAFQRKAQIINIHQFKTSLSDLAKTNLLIHSGGEAALLNGLAREIHQGWQAESDLNANLRADMESRAEGKAWLESLAPFGSSKVESATGIDEVTLRNLAESITGSQKLFVLIGAQLSPEAHKAAMNLAAMKGRADYCAVLNGAPNKQGVRRAGLVPGTKGLSGAQILETGALGGLKVLYIAANNPLNGAAKQDTARRALENTPFVVVQALFENELTAYADVVLPAASFLEQEGTTTNFHGKVQVLKRVFRPRERRNEQGETLSACATDWMIFARLAQILGNDWGWRSPGDATRAFKAIPQGEGEWKFAPAAANSLNEAHSSTAPLGSFKVVTGTLLYDGGESFQYCERLGRVVPKEFVTINRSDARKIGVEPNDTVEIKGDWGRTRALVKVGRAVKEGTVFIPRRLRDLHLNQIAPGNGSLVSLTKVAPQPDLQEGRPSDGVSEEPEGFSMAGQERVK